MIVLLLVAAAFDVAVPRKSGDRARVHLVDRSESVSVSGPRESLTLTDADDIIAHDRDVKAAGDTVTWASFGKTLVWESAAVDATGTDLGLALRAALARNPTEIILYTDGRGDPGHALMLCRQRGVPVHVLPLGPTSVHDIRFRRIQAPASVRAGESYSLEVVVEATYVVEAKVRVDDDVRSVPLAAGVPTVLRFPRPKPGPFVASIEAGDDCPRNNQVSGEVFLETDQPKILALSEGLPLPGVTIASRLPGLNDVDAVLLDNIVLQPAEQQALEAYVRGGGGLVLLGGPKSYALGGWSRTPLEKLSPLKLHPDLKLAVVLGIDASGSMSADYESVVRTLEDVRQEFDEDDDVMGMTFGSTATIKELSALRREQPSGATSVSAGLRAARLHLETREAGRKMIVLMTDGDTAEGDDIAGELRHLKDIGVLIVTTKKTVPGVENIPIKDWTKLRETLGGVSHRIQDLARPGPGLLDLRPHPITAGVSPVPLKSIQRTSPKSDAQVLATVGQPPKQDPVLALRPYGDGRVAAFTLEFDPALERLFRQALDYAVGDRSGGLRLSVDPPLVVAQGDAQDPEFTTDGVRVAMKKVGPRRWEGRLPADLAGSVVVRKGRARATATIPCPPEFASLGVDRAALERIATETGGRVLRSTSELDALPRPERSAPRSGRAAFLIAALVLVFVELGVSIYWKV